MAEETLAEIGLVGLAVMGQNLAVNIADHGFKIAVFNRTTKVTTEFISANPDTPGGLIGCATLAELLSAIKRPRKIIILVKAGSAVDTVTQQLMDAGLEKDDLVIDCG